MISESENSVPSWDATTVQAAQLAKQLRPFALYLFFLALALLVFDIILEPVPQNPWEGREPAWLYSNPWLNGLNHYLVLILKAGAALSLLWGLWVAQRYLGRLEKGGVWSVSTLRLVREIGECMIASAAFSILITPTVTAWVTNYGGFDLRLEETALSLLGLGLMLMVLARVFTQVLESAQQIKAENESFV